MANVSAFGDIALSLPVGDHGRSYRLFTYFESRTLTKNLPVTTNETDIVYNGSYTVDHFSGRGAQTVTNFWDKYILVDGLKELLMEVGYNGKY